MWRRLKAPVAGPDGACIGRRISEVAAARDHLLTAGRTGCPIGRNAGCVQGVWSGRHQGTGIRPAVSLTASEKEIRNASSPSEHRRTPKMVLANIIELVLHPLCPRNLECSRPCDGCHSCADKGQQSVARCRFRWSRRSLRKLDRLLEPENGMGQLPERPYSSETSS